MELIRISDKKIKISLTSAELEDYELTAEMISGSDKRSKKAFRELLVHAKETADFDADGEKVFVQIFRSDGGGCEIFVSLITDKSGASERKRRDGAFTFSGMKDLLSSCRALKRMGYGGVSSAYKSENGYSLILLNATEEQCAYVTEWGRRIEVPNEAYVSEHYLPIRTGDAVSVLSEL